ncbi:MAG TPA: SMC-Scp complex subunit ScpB [Kofleriaceae bacterium]|nr:SMC-Scp complex subunit ScpB [Kofleriaceae bacterium]
MPENLPLIGPTFTCRSPWKTPSTSSSFSQPGIAAASTSGSNSASHTSCGEASKRWSPASFTPTQYQVARPSRRAARCRRGFAPRPVLLRACGPVSRMRKKHKARGRAERAALEQVAAQAGIEIGDDDPAAGEATAEDAPQADAEAEARDAEDGASAEAEQGDAAAGEDGAGAADARDAGGAHEAAAAEEAAAANEGAEVRAADASDGEAADASDGEAAEASDGEAAGASDSEAADASDSDGVESGEVAHAGEPAGGDVAARVADADAGDGGEAGEVDVEDEEAEAADATRPQAAGLDEATFKSLIEALVFASDKPLTIARLRQLTRVSDTRRIQTALEQLQAEHAGTGIVLSAVSGGYSFRTAAPFSSWVQQLIAGRPVRLSRAQLETLAIVAYRQPITRPEIDQIRGVDSGATLKLLLDRSLIRILGKREEVGRPLLYGTTKEFLDFFSLSELRELPTLREYSELTPESRSMVAKLGGEPLPPPAAPVETPAADAGVADAAGAEAAAEPQAEAGPEAVAEPEGEPATAEAASVPEAVGEPEAEAATASDTGSEADAAPDAEPAAEAEGEPAAEAEGEPAAAAEAEGEPEAATEPEAVAEPEGEPHAAPDAVAEAADHHADAAVSGDEGAA